VEIKPKALLSSLVPPLCPACGALASDGPAPLCASCGERFTAIRPLWSAPAEGLDAVWSAAAHDGVARDLVAALKFRRLLSAADAAATRLDAMLPRSLLIGREIVPVPAAPARLRSRGFDPAGEIAARLAKRSGVPLRACLRRRGRGRQRGRSRLDRLAAPPEVRAAAAVPPAVLLIDDVVTTGATLSACAVALREAGAICVSAATFTHET